MRAKVAAIQSGHFAWLNRFVFGLAAGLGLLLATFCLWSLTRTLPVGPRVANRGQVDTRLQHAAIAALSGHEGTVLVMEVQTGRIRAVVNPDIAFKGTFAPGSTIKPFTALASMRAGLITPRSRNVCREHYAHEGFAVTCSHPRDLPPFDSTEAIAYSCNFYFGRVAEGLADDSFRDTLAEFGFGKLTGVDIPAEPPGTLPARGERAQNGLGETPNFQVSPIQLVTAYAALVNGGRLFRPSFSTAEEPFVDPEEQLSILEDQRKSIIDGMRGAVRYGTAEKAKLYSLPLHVIGKTGTSTAADGYRTQGWFVGMASNPNTTAPTAPDQIELAVLVLLKRGQGADAAERARLVFEAYVGALQAGRSDGETGDAATRGRGDLELQLDTRPNVSASPRLRVSASQPLRVSVSPCRPVTPTPTCSIPLEDYVLGVVATEISAETEPEALRAQAIASRSFALGNLGRHSEEGYDFCTTTHCQRYTNFTQTDSRPRARIQAAIKETEGQVLLDSRNQLVQSYFSASCGGTTSNVRDLWGDAPKTYLNGVVDDFCVTMPRRHWTDVISTQKLLAALATDRRTDVGQRLDHIEVSRYDQSGRAEWVTIAGERRVQVRGWDFRIIIGRALGWNILKSSRFEISRTGADYVFRGNGFGHGLGLCQEGAHVMARGGASYRQILEKYFPGTRVAINAKDFSDRRGEVSRLVAPTATILKSHHARVPRRISSEHFGITFPKSVPQDDVESLLRLLEGNRKDLLRRLSNAGVPLALPVVELTVNETTGDFVGRTGQPWWSAAATRGNRIELQPITVLRKRRILETTLRHELVHTVVDLLGNGRTPRWLTEGLAIYIAGEGPMLAPYRPKRELSIDELEKKLSHVNSAAEMRVGYAAAYEVVRQLIKREGEPNVWRRIKTAQAQF